MIDNHKWRPCVQLPSFSAVSLCEWFLACAQLIFTPPWEFLVYFSMVAWCGQITFFFYIVAPGPDFRGTLIATNQHLELLP